MNRIEARVVRRIRHQSSGDHVLPKRPEAGPFVIETVDPD